MTPTLDVKRYVVEILRAGVCAEIDYGRLGFNVETRVEFDEMSRRLFAQLQGAWAGKVDRNSVTHLVPSDWWQAFRERWFPKWWLNRWPVGYRCIEVDQTVTRVCPHLPVGRDYRSHVHFLVKE